MNNENDKILEKVANELVGDALVNHIKFWGIIALFVTLTFAVLSIPFYVSTAVASYFPK